METVTRFIGSKSWYNVKDNTLTTAAFCNIKNRKHGEISVFDIDKELKNNQEDKIFAIGDKNVYKKPPNTRARADLKVIDITKIKSYNEFLRVDRGIFPSKHCNIRPFPNDEAYALNIAAQLVRISTLKIRHKNS